MHFFVVLNNVMPWPFQHTQMWLKESEDVTWDRFLESLSAIDQTELVERVKERLGQYHEQGSKDIEECTDGVDVRAL